MLKKRLAAHLCVLCIVYWITSPLRDDDYCQIPHLCPASPAPPNVNIDWCIMRHYNSRPKKNIDLRVGQHAIHFTEFIIPKHVKIDSVEIRSSADFHAN